MQVETKHSFLQLRHLNGTQIVLVWLMVLFASAVYAQEERPVVESIAVCANFPGGNIVLDSICQDTVFVHQNLKDTQGNWFYWHFSVKGVSKGKTLVFKFTHPWQDLKKTTSVIGVYGPGVSLDKGKTWDWLGVESVSGDSFKYQFNSNDGVVHFSMGMPYTEANFQDFIQFYKGNNHLETGVLALTREGRKVERLHVGKINGSPKHRVVITSRLHASEMMTSYLVEGIIAETLSGGEAGRWLCENVEILIIPFVDKDGVENGEQGKNRRGRDHNRDFSGESIYASSKAIRAFVPVWGKDNLRALIDLHCPYIKGKGGHEQIYLTEPDSGVMRSELRKFAALLEMAAGKEPLLYLPYFASNNLKFGQGFNTSEAWKNASSIRKWASGIPHIQLVATLEFPYANALEYPYASSGTMITQQNARRFGKTMANALYAYLYNLDRTVAH